MQNLSLPVPNWFAFVVTVSIGGLTLFASILNYFPANFLTQKDGVKLESRLDRLEHKIDILIERQIDK